MSFFDLFKKKDATPKSKPAPIDKSAKKVSFYIDVYQDGKCWVCEEGGIYSDGSRRTVTKYRYKTQDEAEYAKLMQLH